MKDKLDNIYLDNAATTQVDTEVAQCISDCLLTDYGNPASAHHLGVTAEQRVKTADAALRRAVKDDGRAKILWTSGGTESDAIGILGAARANQRRGKRIVVSAIEHSAVRESAQSLAQDGFEVVVIPVSTSGIVDPEEFAAACDGAAVAGLMLINNEIGTRQPVEETVEAIRASHPEVHIHCDAVQALGKVDIDVAQLGVDSIAFAAHKLHGPKGVGALWLREKRRIRPLWVGGGQQGGLRAGTLNVPGIAGFGRAIEIAVASIEDKRTLYASFSELICDAARRSGVQHCINGEQAPRAPHILSIAFAGIPAEPLLHVLESRGVMVSAGSACSERSRRASPVLTAIALGADFGTIRFSFGRTNSRADVESAAAVLEDALKGF